MTIGEKVKQARLTRKISQRELGKRIGVSQQTIAITEHSENTLNFSTLYKIASALDIDVLQLIPSNFDDCNNFYLFLDVCQKQTTDNRKNIFDMIIRLNDSGQLNVVLGLNNKGQQKAIEQIELLAKIPEYQASTTDVEGDPADNKK